MSLLIKIGLAFAVIVSALAGCGGATPTPIIVYAAPAPVTIVSGPTVAPTPATLRYEEFIARFWPAWNEGQSRFGDLGDAIRTNSGYDWAALTPTNRALAAWAQDELAWMADHKIETCGQAMFTDWKRMVNALKTLTDDLTARDDAAAILVLKDVNAAMARVAADADLRPCD